MKYLVDTHAFLWFSIDDERLPIKIRDLISDINNEIYVSTASTWEIVIKYQLGKLILPTKPEIFIPEQLEDNNFSILPISLYHTFQIRDLPFHHKDPFDRMLVAQSKVENMPILSSDIRLKDYDVELVW